MFPRLEPERRGRETTMSKKRLKTRTWQRRTPPQERIPLRSEFPFPSTHLSKQYIHQSRPTPKPKDPPKSPLKNRETSRLKEFPAGNAATSTSRTAFIRSLCQIPKFLSLADSIPVMVGNLLLFLSSSSLTSISAQAVPHTHRLPSVGIMEKQRSPFTTCLPPFPTFRQFIGDS